MTNINKQKHIHIIIQARSNSTRLPNKILLPFVGGFTFLEWIVERAKTSSFAEKVIVATTESVEDYETEVLCKRRKYDYFRGSEEDVLGRYWKTVERFGSKIIVRVTSDNPFIDIPEMDRVIGMLQSENLDYANNHSAGLPIGTGVEVFTRESFIRVVAEAKDKYEHEHVTPYYYRHPELFKQMKIPPLNVHKFSTKVRLTIDTIEDLNFLRALSNGIGFSDPFHQPSTNEILSFLQLHSEIVAINNNVQQKTLPQ